MFDTLQPRLLKNALTSVDYCFFPIGFVALHSWTWITPNQQVMPDDHSKSVPPLPIPNRTVKRLRANDSAATSVKVGHRQALIRKTPSSYDRAGGFLLLSSQFYSPALIPAAPRFCSPVLVCYFRLFIFYFEVLSSLWLSDRQGFIFLRLMGTTNVWALRCWGEWLTT